MRIQDWDGHRDVTLEQVAAAKGLLKKGLDLQQAARVVGCLTRDLDLGIWHYIGFDLAEIKEPAKPEPMFD